MYKCSSCGQALKFFMETCCSCGSGVGIDANVPVDQAGLRFLYRPNRDDFFMSIQDIATLSIQIKRALFREIMDAVNSAARNPVHKNNALGGVSEVPVLDILESALIQTARKYHYTI